VCAARPATAAAHPDQTAQRQPETERSKPDPDDERKPWRGCRARFDNPLDQDLRDGPEHGSSRRRPRSAPERHGTPRPRRNRWRHARSCAEQRQRVEVAAAGRLARAEVQVRKAAARTAGATDAADRPAGREQLPAAHSDGAQVLVRRHE
jgi:hypothetical protein